MSKLPSVVSPRAIAASLAETWSPRVIAEVDDAYVKTAKIHGELVWHAHAEEDELFLVLAGRMRIELPDRAVALREGELFVVPKGTPHKPSAEEECLVLLIERKSTAHTGDVVAAQTRSLDEQLRGYSE